MSKKNENNKTTETVPATDVSMPPIITDPATDSVAEADTDNSETAAQITTPDTTSPADTGTSAEQQPENTDPLKTLADHAVLLRIPSWQNAALLRLKGWTADKKISTTEYVAALNQLLNRRIGS